MQQRSSALLVNPQAVHLHLDLSSNPYLCFRHKTHIITEKAAKFIHRSQEELLPISISTYLRIV
jgi:hypothetical protein